MAACLYIPSVCHTLCQISCLAWKAHTTGHLFLSFKEIPSQAKKFWFLKKGFDGERNFSHNTHSNIPIVK